MRCCSLGVSDVRCPVDTHLAPCRFSIRKITLRSILTSSKKASRSMVRCNFSQAIRLHDSNVGILDNTRTTLGRNLLREWLLRPSLSLPIINARHAAVACFVNPENMTTADDIQKHLSGIKNTPRILKMLKSGTAKVKDWQGVVEVRTQSYHAMLLHAVR